MNTSGLNILIATPHFPYPLIGGERIKLFNLIKHLSKNNKVFLVSLDRGYEVKEEFIDVIKSMNVETHVFYIHKWISTLSAGLLTLFRHPLEIEYFRHAKFRKKINEIIENNKIDLVLNFFIRTAEHVKNIPVKKILIAEDCRSYYQRRTSNSSNHLRQKLERKYDAFKLSKYEADILNYFDITTVVTQEDFHQFYLLNSKAEIRIISEGVDYNFFSPVVEAKNRKDILFLGKLDVWANIIMVKKIVNEIFPLILKSNPEAKLNIVGSNPTREILDFQSTSINIHKNPENITSYYQQSAVFLHPHLGGSGIQNKVLESMSSACPVVTSPSGANGINIINGINGFIADNNEEFTSYTIELLNNNNLREKIGNNARNYIIREKSWESVFSAWDKMIEEIM
jgi:glycosyltransferase involved in cell wall biosynthesis